MSVVLPLDPVRAEPGFGPQWWSSGVRTWRWWAAGAAVVAIEAGDIWGTAASITPGWQALYTFAAAAEVAVALLFWMWRPGNIVGPLLIAYVSLIALGQDLPTWFPNSRFAWTVLGPGQFGWTALYVWMLLSFPNGRMWNRPALWLTIWMSIVYLAGGMPQALWGTPKSYFSVGTDSARLDVANKGFAVLFVINWFLLCCFLLARIVGAAPGARRRLVPLYGALIILGLWDYCYWAGRVVFDAQYASWWGPLESAGVVPLISAVGAAFGLARVRQKRSSVADLVVELGRIEPGRVRETLARTLGDPSLQLGLWLPDRHIWVEENGQELVLPHDHRLAVTYVGNQLAVMVHHPDLLDQPRLLEAVGSAGRLALENERLQAELRAQLRELQTSRARIVRTADEERRRLERDLHDGAQQRLLGLGMGLHILASHLKASGTELLGELQGELDEALRELRELARGIHPAVLTDQGLDAAVRTLAQRARLRVTVTTAGERPPAHVETAAYFVVSEALANVAKYAHATRASVALTRDNGDLRVEVADDGVGGATLGAGSGLTGLADRVGALGGRFSLDSPPGAGTRLSALIPCGGEAT